MRSTFLSSYLYQQNKYVIKAQEYHIFILKEPRQLSEIIRNKLHLHMLDSPPMNIYMKM